MKESIELKKLSWFYLKENRHIEFKDLETSYG